MNQSFWKNRRVLITGHTGFKGSWLSLWLEKLGADVVGYSLPPQTTPNLFQLANVEKGISSIFDDIRDLNKLSEVLKQHEPEIVFHLAAQSLVRLSYEEPVNTYAVNVMGTVNMLEAIRNTHSVEAAVIITSDKCYENREQGSPFREIEPMGGFDPYSSSKGCAELICAAYRSSFFRGSAAGRVVPLATARAGNVIGGGDWAKDRLIPDIVCSIAKNQPMLVRHPDAIRPWQHVLESLAGYITLAERLYQTGVQYAEAWNFGPSPNNVKPVRWIIERLAYHYGLPFEWKHDSSSNPHEAHHLSLDSSKSREFLQWSPKWSLDQSLKVIADWYHSYNDGQDVRETTLDQINFYENNSDFDRSKISTGAKQENV